jgi:hypothetical protein
VDGDAVKVSVVWDGARYTCTPVAEPGTNPEDTRYRLPGWDAARTLYGIRLVRPAL